MEFTKWVSAWSNATSILTRQVENYTKDLTLRYPMKIVFSGSKLKFTFSNYCGSEAVTITGATVALSDEKGNLEENTIKDITFEGSKSVTIEKGTELKSDAIDIEVKANSYISLSIYLGDFTETRSSVLVTGPLSKGYYCLGNQTRSKTLPAEKTKYTNWFYFINNVEILTEENNNSLICYGDSITAQSWPDYLTERCIDKGYKNTSIVRRAVCGTRVLRQYDCIQYDSYGLKGSNRFEREISTVSGAKAVIIQHGINDIIHPVGIENNIFRPWSDLPTANELIDGLKSYIETAKKLGLKVYGGTLIPIEGWRTYADFREELKNQVNDWIRTTKDLDGCIDFDKAVRDENRPSSFREGFDSGDHLHPSEIAYKAMADAVPEILLK
ncbi:MAG: lipase [Oscillospiraceae bacterium]|nr:lipase [Oscillospiraceae bacterium]